MLNEFPSFLESMNRHKKGYEMLNFVELEKCLQAHEKGPRINPIYENVKNYDEYLSLRL